MILSQALETTVGQRSVKVSGREGGTTLGLKPSRDE